MADNLLIPPNSISISWYFWVRPAPIARLFGISGPTAIIRLIVSIAIDSVNRFSFWARSHVFKEILELVPAVANNDPSSAIVLKHSAGFGGTSRSHRSPRHIGAGSHASGAIAMNSNCFDMKAAATFLLPILDITSPHINNFSTLTLAYPGNTNPQIWSALDDEQSVEFLSCKIKKRWHSSPPKMVDNVTYHVGYSDAK